MRNTFGNKAFSFMRQINIQSERNLARIEAKGLYEQQCAYQNSWLSVEYCKSISKASIMSYIYRRSNWKSSTSIPRKGIADILSAFEVIGCVKCERLNCYKTLRFNTVKTVTINGTPKSTQISRPETNPNQFLFLLRNYIQTITPFTLLVRSLIYRPNQYYILVYLSTESQSIFSNRTQMLKT